MKFNFIVFFVALMSLNVSFSTELDLCEPVPTYQRAKCQELAQNSKLEQIPAELCQFRMTPGEIMECYQAIANRTYAYEEILDCAALHRYDIPYCLAELGQQID